MKITKEKHPNRHDIIGRSKNKLLNRQQYVYSALNSWTDNRYNLAQTIVDYNINFFQIELELINNELKKQI